ncbi:MAG: hypothetical protein QOC56_1579 [Alphaproteobacteria bacterium]|nr:hypothetical protein [Alphaproteobacteria bacterium]
MGHWPSIQVACGRVVRIACVLAIGALLSGCDRCGDWWSALKGQTQSCKDEVPRRT